MITVEIKEKKYALKVKMMRTAQLYSNKHTKKSQNNKQQQRMMRTDIAIKGRCFQLVATEGRLHFSESPVSSRRKERVIFKSKKGEVTKC